MISYAAHIRNAEATFLQGVITLLHAKQSHVAAEITKGASLTFLKFEGRDSKERAVTGTVCVNLIDAYTCMLTVTVSSSVYRVPDSRQHVRPGELTARMIVDVVLTQLGLKAPSLSGTPPAPSGGSGLE